MTAHAPTPALPSETLEIHFPELDDIEQYHRDMIELISLYHEFARGNLAARDLLAHFTDDDIDFLEFMEKRSHLVNSEVFKFLRQARVTLAHPPKPEETDQG